MIFESVIDWQSGHADIDAGLQGIMVGIQPQNGRMLSDSIAQENHVDVMVKRLFLLTRWSLNFQSAEK